MVILLPTPFGQAVIKEPLVVEYYIKTGVLHGNCYQGPWTWKNCASSLIMHGLSMVILLYDSYILPLYFKLKYFNFLWFKIDHFAIVTKRKSRLFHIHRPWKKLHAKSSPVLGMQLSITFKTFTDWSTEIFLLCDNGSYFEKLLLNHNKLSVALMLIKSNDLICSFLSHNRIS